jgi:hypothetical protein
LFGHLECEYLNVLNISKFIDWIDLSEFGSTMCSSLCNRLQFVSLFSLNVARYPTMSVESLIVGALPLSFWKCQANNLSRLHRGSRDRLVHQHFAGNVMVEVAQFRLLPRRLDIFSVVILHMFGIRTVIVNGKIQAHHFSCH